MLRCRMRKMYVVVLVLAAIVACHTKDNVPTTNPDDNTRPGCAALRQPLQLAYSADAKGQAELANAVVVADNVAMMMRECEQAPARVIACVNAHPIAAEITQLCTTPIDDAGSEGNVRFGGVQ